MVNTLIQLQRRDCKRLLTYPRKYVFVLFNSLGVGAVSPLGIFYGANRPQISVGLLKFHNNPVVHILRATQWCSWKISIHVQTQTLADSRIQTHGDTHDHIYTRLDVDRETTENNYIHM